MSRRPRITCTQLSSYNSIDSSGCCVFFDCFFARQHQGQLNCYVLLFDGTITHTRSRFQTVSAENKQAGVSLLCVCVWVSNSIIGFFSLLDFLVRVGYVHGTIYFSLRFSPCFYYIDVLTVYSTTIPYIIYLNVFVSWESVVQLASWKKKHTKTLCNSFFCFFVFLFFLL